MDVSHTAELLKGYYASYRGHRPSVTSNGAFLSAARICERLQADPEVYFMAQIKSGMPIYPNSIGGACAEKNYKSYIAAKDVSYDKLYLLNVKYLREAVACGLDPDKVLCNPNIPFEPWFRIYASAGNKEIAGLYGEAATKELTPALVEFLEKKRNART